MNEQQASTSNQLLPPFDPLPPLTSTFASTPDFSSFPSRSNSPTPASTPHRSPGPFPAIINSRRLRSNSLHSPAVPSSSSRAYERNPPPVPSLSSTPRTSRIASDSSGIELSPPSFRQTRAPDSSSSTSSIPLINSVTVPNYSKAGKNWLFACRVVPRVEGKGKAKVYGLGKMEMANEQEPYTVYRSWSECVDFEKRLAKAFPDDRQSFSDSTSTNDLPASFYHQIPRLTKKLVLFMTRSVLEQRKSELDLFCRRLLQMPTEVRDSLIVRHFFALNINEIGNHLDFSTTETLAAFTLPPHVDERESDQFATIKPIKSKPRRPVLAVKTSTPNLRSAMKPFGDEFDSLSPESARPVAANRSFTVDGAGLRASSEYSMASAISTASSTTITPSLYAARVPTLAIPSPQPSPSNPDGRFKTLRKKASGPLRHFRSLQDLRGSSNSSSLDVPDLPVPALRPGLAPTPMLRTASQPPTRPSPHPLYLGAPIRLPSGGSGAGPSSAPLRPSHRKTNSSSSSIISAEDLWGTSFPFPTPSTTFRQTPTGRLESVPLQTSQRSYSSSSQRREAGARGGASISTNNASCGHSSTASISSLESLRSSIRSFDEGSGSGSRSARNSFDWGSTECPTPPTPQSPWNEATRKDSSFAQYNMVPPPPFFPVPPPMTSCHSHDGLPRTPRSSQGRRSSLELSTTSSSSRSRKDSTASHLLGSPSTISNGSASPALGGNSDPRPKWTFKLLHASENVVLRIAKEELTLTRLRNDTRIKFSAAGVELAAEDAHWGLCSVVKEGNEGSSKLIIREEDLEECLASSTGKITFRIIA